MSVRRSRVGALVLLLVGTSSFASAALAQVVRYDGAPDAIDHTPYIHAVSARDSPIEPHYIKAKDGVYIAAALRKPAGPGPFPAIVIFHGAPGGRGMEQLIGWSRGDHGGPVWERFLKEGFVVVVADYRGGPYNDMNRPSASGLITAIDDGVSVIEHVQSLPYVDAARVSTYGVSLGGNLALFLAAKVPTLHTVVLGAPAPIWFLGHTVPEREPRPNFAALPLNASVVEQNIAPIRAPLLIQVGTADSLMPLTQVLHEQLTKYGKPVRTEIYTHGYHDFVMGPQGQPRGSDLPQGEILMQGTLDALERSVEFVKRGGAR